MKLLFKPLLNTVLIGLLLTGIPLQAQQSSPSSLSQRAQNAIRWSKEKLKALKEKVTKPKELTEAQLVLRHYLASLILVCTIRIIFHFPMHTHRAFLQAIRLPESNNNKKLIADYLKNKRVDLNDPELLSQLHQLFYRGITSYQSPIIDCLLDNSIVNPKQDPELLYLATNPNDIENPAIDIMNELFVRGADPRQKNAQGYSVIERYSEGRNSTWTITSEAYREVYRMLKEKAAELTTHEMHELLKCSFRNNAPRLPHDMYGEIAKHLQ